MRDVKGSWRQKTEGYLGGCLCIIAFVLWAVLGINTVIHTKATELQWASAGSNENRTRGGGALNQPPQWGASACATTASHTVETIALAATLASTHGIDNTFCGWGRDANWLAYANLPLCSAPALTGSRAEPRAAIPGLDGAAPDGSRQRRAAAEEIYWAYSGGSGGRGLNRTGRARGQEALLSALVNTPLASVSVC